MTAEDNQQQELEVAVGDKKLKFRGSDWLSLLGTAVGVLLVYMIWEHKVEAADLAKTTAQVLREASKENAQALKESQAAMIEAIKQMTKEQQRANEIGREQTCLLTLPPDRRTNAGEFCKRLSRERDR